MIPISVCPEEKVKNEIGNIDVENVVIVVIVVRMVKEVSVGDVGESIEIEKMVIEQIRHLIKLNHKPPQPK